MDGEFVFSEHSLLRITERMKLTGAEVYQKVKAGLMVEVATVGLIGARKYGVLWDPVAKKPFLLIWRNEEGVWSLRTVYETFPNHWRKDWIVIKPYHCYGAKKRHLDILFRQEEANRLARRSVVLLDLIVRYMTPQRKPRTGRYPIGQVSREDFETRLQSDVKLLLDELLSPESLENIKVPTDAEIYYEAHRRVERGKLIVGGGRM